MNTDQTQIHQNSSPICENLCKSVLSFLSNHLMKPRLLCVLSIVVTYSNLPAAELKTVDDFRGAAAKANSALTIPDWEQTPEAVEASMKHAIAKANGALDQIGAQDPGKVTFK